MNQLISNAIRKHVAPFQVQGFARAKPALRRIRREEALPSAIRQTVDREPGDANPGKLLNIPTKASMLSAG